MYVCMYLFIHFLIYVFMYVFIYYCNKNSNNNSNSNNNMNNTIHVYTYIYTYIYIHAYIYIYIHLFIYIYIHSIICSFRHLQAQLLQRRALHFRQFVLIHGLPLQFRIEPIPHAWTTSPGSTSSLEAVGLGIPHRAQRRDHGLLVEEGRTAASRIYHKDHVLEQVPIAMGELRKK